MSWSHSVRISVRMLVMVLIIMQVFGTMLPHTSLAYSAQLSALQQTDPDPNDDPTYADFGLNRINDSGTIFQPEAEQRYTYSENTGAEYNRWTMYFHDLAPFSEHNEIDYPDDCPPFQQEPLAYINLWNWDRFDTIIAADHDHGLEPVVTLQGTPHCYQANKPNSEPAKLLEPVFLDTSGNPTNDITEAGSINPQNYWALFVYQATLRYGGTGEDKVQYWQVWNEQNDEAHYWKLELGDGNSPEARRAYAYARMLEVTYLATQLSEQQGGFDITLLMGGFSDVNRGANLHAFLTSLNTQSSITNMTYKDYVDRYAAHRYIGPWATFEWVNYLQQNGLGDKPYWLTETGTNPAQPQDVPQDARAAYVMQLTAYMLTLGGDYNIEKWFHFQLDDSADNTGLLNPDFTPRSIYTATLILNEYLHDVTPYPGQSLYFTPTIVSNVDFNHGYDHQEAYFTSPDYAKITMLWSTSEQVSTVSITPQFPGTPAQLVWQDGVTQTIQPDSTSGLYEIDLPPRTHSAISGKTVLLLEKDPSLCAVPGGGVTTLTANGTVCTLSTVDVVLIIDSSGSMTSNDPANRRKAAAQAYLSASLAGDYVGVVDFDGSARIASGLRRLPDERLALVSAINTIDSAGTTNIGAGVQAGCNVLTNSLSGNTRRAAILLTDGQGSYSNQAQCFINQGWTIYTFGFGSSDDAVLQQIATATGGEFQRLPTTNLVCEFQRVRGKIAGSDPGPCETVTVNPNQTTTINKDVPINQDLVTFSASRDPGADVAISLRTPSGQIIDAATIDANVTHDRGTTYETYSVARPEAGTWQVELTGTSVPAAGTSVVLGTTVIPAPASAIPTADAGGPYVGYVGEAILLDARGSTDTDGTIVSYRWDVDNDGVFDLTTPTATTNYTYAGVYSATISLEVVDNDGRVAQATTMVAITEVSEPNISGFATATSGCVVRYDTDVAARMLTIQGANFPAPRTTQNIQFRRSDTGAESIYFGQQVEWHSATDVALDLEQISHLLWPDVAHMPVQVRFTEYDPATGGQIPLSDWSVDIVIVALNTSACTPQPAGLSLDPACVVRSGGTLAERQIVLTGINFPAPRTTQNIQFRRSDTGAESIYFGQQVEWRSATEVALDLEQISHLLWPDVAHMPVQVRFTEYDPATGGQLPLSAWSQDQVVIAATQADCTQ